MYLEMYLEKKNTEVGWKPFLLFLVLLFNDLHHVIDKNLLILMFILC